MLEFRKLTLGDKNWVDEVLCCSEHQGCVYTFAQFYLWADMYNTTVCRVGDALCSMAGRDRLFYMYPAGRYDIRNIIEILADDARERGIPFVFAAVEEWQKDELFSAFPGRFCAVESRDDFDYIYRAEDLAQLKGKKYHSKRNHISKFVRAFPEWCSEKISAENIDDCRILAEKWFAEKEEDGSLAIEKRLIARVFDDMQAYGLEGILLRSEPAGEAVAFAVGEKLNRSIYDIHFEKALSKYDGAYAMINREFAAFIAQKYEYINREEDMGIEGLRKAKLSYYPAILLKKYMIAEVES